MGKQLTLPPSNSLLSSFYIKLKLLILTFQAAQVLPLPHIVYISITCLMIACISLNPLSLEVTWKGEKHQVFFFSNSLWWKLTGSSIEARSLLGPHLLRHQASTTPAITGYQCVFVVYRGGSSGLPGWLKITCKESKALHGTGWKCYFR